jgi:CRISPR system Cascade subunit CasB
MANDDHYTFNKEALRRWWKTLDDYRGRRAQLRRCHTLDEVMHKLAFQAYARPRLLGSGVRGSDEQLAAVAGLLAHIRDHAPEHKSFAAQMATSDSAGGRPPVSEMRFRRLLRKESRAALYKPLRRVLYILGTPPRANIFEVAQDVIYWGDAVRRRWAEDYYAVLFKGEPVPEADTQSAMWKAWWEELQQPERRGERAALRRCTTLDKVMLATGYHRLLQYLRTSGFYKERNKDQHAAIAGLLARVEQDDDRHAFAKQMALPDRAAEALANLDEESDDYKEKRHEVRNQIQNGNFGSAPLSGLRFRRLVQIEDCAVLFRKLIRTISLLGGRANVTDLADAVFFWNDDRRRDWSFAYYQHAPSDEP